MDIHFSECDNEYIDGCFSGIICIKKNDKFAYCKFFYDVEMDSLNLTETSVPSWNVSTMDKDISDWIVDIYYHIKLEILNYFKVHHSMNKF